MSRIKYIIYYLAISIVIYGLCFILESTFFFEFLRENIVVLLITLLAINTATISVIVAKLHEISISVQKNFDKTIKEVKVSLLEQIILIAVSSLLLIFYHSPVIQNCFKYYNALFDTLFTVVFIYSIDILRDTGIAIFEIIKHPTSKDNT